jgi:hypothetical protein
MVSNPSNRRRALRMTIQGHRIPVKVDWEMRSILWVLIIEGRKLKIRTLTSGISSLLDVTGQF